MAHPVYSVELSSLRSRPLTLNPSPETDLVWCNWLLEKIGVNPFDVLNTPVTSLGTELFAYQAPSPLSPTQEDANWLPTGYLLLRGRVRLLCGRDRRGRPYAAGGLQAGDLFGVDHWFVEAPLPYQVIAASDCLIVPIVYAQLVQLRRQCPSLWNYWQMQTQQRLQQLFFKRYTPLQRLSSQTLARLLPTHLRTFKLEAGQLLQEKVMPYEGYFWVRSGTLTVPSASPFQLTVGNGWRDRDLPFRQAVADVPSLIYQLAFQPWEAGDISPILEKLDFVC